LRITQQKENAKLNSTLSYVERGGEYTDLGDFELPNWMIDLKPDVVRENWKNIKKEYQIRKRWFLESPKKGGIYAGTIQSAGDRRVRLRLEDGIFLSIDLDIQPYAIPNFLVLFREPSEP
jgi:hypothetical protein